MKLPRRQFLRLAAGAAALPAVSRIARADTYPNRPLHIVVGFPPGQSADISARLLGQWLSDRLGQPVIIDNKPGASSSVATELVVRAAPDGYTLLWVVTSNYINATLYKQLPLQLHPRHRAGRQQHAHAARHGGDAIAAGENRARVHRLRQGASRQAQHGFGRHRQLDAHGRRIVQDDDRHQDAARALSRLGAGAHRLARPAKCR